MTRTLPLLKWLYNALQPSIPCSSDSCVSVLPMSEIWSAIDPYDILRCTNRTNHTAWNTLSTCKNRIIEFVWSPTVSVGVKLSAMKFVQRVILVQTRGISDPRVAVYNLFLYRTACNPEYPYLLKPHSFRIKTIRTFHSAQPITPSFQS